jgi:hypothetical protein
MTSPASNSVSNSADYATTPPAIDEHLAIQGMRYSSEPEGLEARRNRGRNLLLHPLLAICLVQATLSLTLVWSNTAFEDEAGYLWLGRLVIAHWLHGASWPTAYPDRFLSGSPLLYPPLGALANSLAGLAGARILALGFMLGATVLLYFTASEIVGRVAALFAIALWAVSEPVLRLAFATIDPPSIFLTALSAWLILQATHRRFRNELIAVAGLSLAVANATAYSGLIIDPIVIAFSFFVWTRNVGARKAAVRTGWFSSALLLFFAGLISFSHSWAAITNVLISHSTSKRQSILLVVSDSWTYTGLIISLAIIGGIVAIKRERWANAGLMSLLACSGFAIPIAQIHDQTAQSLAKHLAYGVWFAVIAAGYGCNKIIHWLPSARRWAVALSCALALVFPAVNGWISAWDLYHEWANARSFVAALRPVVAGTDGLIYAGTQSHIGEYYTPQGQEWRRWTGAISLGQLRSGRFGVIALFYPASSSVTDVPTSVLLSAKDGEGYRRLLVTASDSSNNSSLAALTLALEKDSAYRLVAVGPYNSGVSVNRYAYGMFAIWSRGRGGSGSI